MKYFVISFLCFLLIQPLSAQQSAHSKTIVGKNLFLRTQTPVLLDSIELDLPVDGTLWSQFEGNTVVSVGDMITLATHLYPYWQTNDGNTSTYALDSNHVQMTFGHSRTWKVEAGKHKVYAMAHNWTDRLGTGFADITAQLSVVFVPDEQDYNSQNGLGFYIYPFAFGSPQRVIKSFEIPKGKEKWMCIAYDGIHYGLTGDKIEYQLSTDSVWRSDLPHQDVAFTSIYKARNINMQTCFEKQENDTVLYLLGNKTAGNLNTGENAVYSNLAFHDSPISLIPINATVGNEIQLIQKCEYPSDKRGKLLVRCTASASAANSGSLLVGIGNEEASAIVDTAVMMQSYTGAHEREYFSFTRLIDVTEGMVSIPIMASRVGSSESVFIEGQVYFQMIPEQVISSTLYPNDKVSFTIYPNPGAQILHIAHKETDQAVPVSVMFFDTQGKLWMEQRINGGNEAHLDVSTLAAGLYHVVIFVDGQYHTYNYIHE